MVLGLAASAGALAEGKPGAAADAAARAESAEQLNEAAFAEYQAGRYAAAEPMFRRAIDAFERQYGADHPDRWNSIGILANTISLAGRPAEAMPLMEQVLAFMERSAGADSIETLRAANNLAVTYWLLGRYAEAEPLFVRTLAGRERQLGPEDPSTLSVIPSLANVYNNQQRFAEAEALYRRAAETSLRVLGRDHSTTAGAVSNLGGFYKLRGRYAEGEPFLLQALEDDTRVRGAENPNTLISMTSAADLYRLWRRFDRAEPMYRRLLDLEARVNGEDHPGTQTARFGLAWILRETGRLPEAEPLADRVYQARLRTLGGDNPDTLNAAELLASIRLQAGRGGDALEPARRLLAGSLARRSGGGAGRSAEAQRHREESQGVGRLSLVADAAWASAEGSSANRAPLRDEAFAALQEAMAGPAGRSIVRMAVRRYADQSGAGLGSLVRERESLDDQWTVNQNALAATFGRDGPDVETARQRLNARRSAIEARLVQIDERLGRDFPDYFALVQPAPVEPAAAQRLLDPDEAILIVVPTPHGTHAMALTRERFEWQRAPLDAAGVDAIVQRLRWDLGAQVSAPAEQLQQWQAQAALAAGGPSFDRSAAHRLHQALVAPLAGVLAGKRRVYVAAAGPLAGLPFSVLVTEPPQGADDDPEALRGTAWLADRHALVHIPTIQSFASLRRQARAAPASSSSDFVGIGDPVLDGAAARRGLSRGAAAPLPAASSLFARGATRTGAALADSGTLRRLARLPGTALELESLRAAFGAALAAIFTAQRATETAVRSADLSQARVLAFATHGLLAGDLESMAEPGLVLTPPTQPSEADDGYLAASEVAALRLDAEWVILSACNTATGDSTDGLSGLARAFFHAGARGLLASHWPVDDAVAPRITVRTVELQRGGASRAEAFQQAIREVRTDASQEWAHPFYWAPFVLIGDGG